MKQVGIIRQNYIEGGNGLVFNHLEAYVAKKHQTFTVFPSLFQERRTEKKANKLAFMHEKQMQEKQMVNLRANVQGMKLS